MPELNIIVRMPNWIGDLVMATPILEDVKKRFPNAKLTAMCQHPLGELLEHDPNVDEIFSFHRSKGLLRRMSGRNIVGKLRQGKFDVGILLTNSFSSAWWFCLGGVKKRLGFGRPGLVTHCLPKAKRAKNRHLVKIYKDLLDLLGIPRSETEPKLYVSDEELEKARAFLQQVGGGRPIVGMNPGAAYGEAKCWLPERFEAVATRMIEDGGRVLFFGDGAKAGICPQKAVNLAGKTSLRELMTLLASCDVLVTNDSGPMHMAAALGTPVVALFGSTSPEYTGPCGKSIVIRKKVYCSPCFKRVCPIDFRCMKRIETDEVYESMKKMMRK